MKPAAIGFRRAGPGDADAVRSLTRECYAKWVPVIGREPKPMTADYDRAVRRHWIELLEDGRGLCGLVEIIPGEGHLLVENLAVRKDRQGMGLGGRLLGHVEALARSGGFGEIRLYTNAAFAENLSFYLHHGYQERARTPLADGGVMVHFVKSVS